MASGSSPSPLRQGYRIGRVNPLAASLRSAPLPHFVGARNWRQAMRVFLSPGQGERWSAKQTGEEVLSFICDGPALEDRNRWFR
jgi:hypothetical protein